MEVIYLPDAEADLDFWIASGNRAILKKIAQLTTAILKSPYDGIGKPESLKYGLAGLWSRRITNEYRFVYLVEDDTLFAQSLRGHY